jgi:ABC-type molybdenum transport system ATPase subunit/photorepair protein PhrA
MLFAFEKAALRSGQRIVLSDIDWRVREGEHWAVLGPNGSGKSTLLRAVLGTWRWSAAVSAPRR